MGGALWINVNIQGAPLETISFTSQSDSSIIECTTNADGNGIITVKVGETYTLKGSISGYEKTVTIEENTDTIKDMPDGKIVYWYGLFSKESGGISKAYSDNTAYQGLTIATNYFRLYSNLYKQCAATVNKIDFTNYSRINVTYKQYRTTLPDGWVGLSNTSYFIVTDRTRSPFNNSGVDTTIVFGEVYCNNTKTEIVTQGKDISLTGSYYVEVFDNYKDAGTLTYAIWLE